MKPSRQADLCSRGVLHLWPQDELMYVPLVAVAKCASELQVDALLVKVTDFSSMTPPLVELMFTSSLNKCASCCACKGLHLQSCECIYPAESSVCCCTGFSFGAVVMKVHRYVAVVHPSSGAIVQAVTALKHGGVPIVDDLPAVAIVADRLRLRACLADIERDTDGRVAMPRAICAHNEAQLREELCDHQAVTGDAWLVKPAVACGIHQAHAMSLVFDASHVPGAVRYHELLERWSAPPLPIMYL